MQMKKDAEVLLAIKSDSAWEESSHLTRLRFKHKPIRQLAWEEQ